MYLSTRQLKSIGISVAVVALCGLLWMMQPETYEAETTIIVSPQQIPASYVQTTVTSDMTARTDLIRAQLMSSTRLQRIIDTFDLYKDMKGRYTQEEIVEHFRGDIHVEVLPHVIKIRYRGHNPPIVAQVTNQLASMFIEENLKLREQLAEGTSEFIDARLVLARANLEQQTARINPAKPAQNAQLLFDLEILRENYRDLLKKKMDADMAADLEKRQKSERFLILDPARIPEKPVSRIFRAGAGN